MSVTAGVMATGSCFDLDPLGCVSPQHSCTRLKRPCMQHGQARAHLAVCIQSCCLSLANRSLEIQHEINRASQNKILGLKFLF